ncbi:MAG: hypothetical protein M3521_00825 [Acidobacteriota bacterium]|nr:hypothetical protein [Acidobacteriota bacterium]MDQ3372418.1 hypothetical protein [Acidobacteriota bacterium]
MKTKKEKNIQPAENLSSELGEQRWSIITFEGIVESDLTYNEAAAKIKKLATEKVPGLCIVTNEVAENFSR